MRRSGRAGGRRGSASAGLGRRRGPAPTRGRGYTGVAHRAARRAPPVSSELDLDALLDAALAAAGAGAAVVAEAFGRARNVREKGPGDWVSDADTSSEATIRKLLHDAAPEVAFFGEEGGGERADVGWFVDPLDGTANFVHGFPVVGVSI